MSNAKSSRSKWSIISFTLAALAAFSVPMLGQGTQPASPLSGGVVEDWSHHHLIFSNPGTEQEALDHGTYARWWQVVNDPRYALQHAKRSSGTKTLDESSVHAVSPFADVGAGRESSTLRTGFLGFEPPRVDPRIPERLRPVDGLSQDWDKALITGGTVEPTMFPAKFSFSTTTASCTSDYVVFPTGMPGVGTTQASIIAYNELYTGGSGCTTAPSVYWAYNTGSEMVTLSPVISNDSTGSQVAFIQSSGTTASLVILKWAASTTETLTAPDNLTVQASASAYRSCIAPCYYSVPLVSASTARDDTYSSPFYDYADDAMYVGDDAGYLHKITGVFNGTTIAEASGWPVLLPAGSYTATGSLATASPEVTLTVGTFAPGDLGAPISGTNIPAGDTISAILSPTTANLTTAPTAVHAAEPLTITREKLSSPVYDSASGYAFAGSLGGILYSVGTGNVGTTNATINGTSSALGEAGSQILDGPLVDSSAGTVYAFVSDGPTGSSTNYYYVYQFPTSFTSGTGNNGSPQELGIGYIQYGLLAGAFDNVYFASTSGTGGNLWVVGNMGDNGGTTAGSNLYYVPINGSGQMTTPVDAFPNLTVTGGTGGWTSDITEFCNNGTSACGVGSGATTCGTAGVTCTNAGKDYIYFSTDNLETTTGTCTTGGGSHDCVLGFNVSNISTTAGTVPAFSKTPVGETGSAGGVSSPGCWSTGGFIVDNALTSSTTPAETGGSQIYYYALGSTTAGNSPGGPTTPIPNADSVVVNCGNFLGTATPQAYQQSQSAP
jgi:hypothetical protein